MERMKPLRPLAFLHRLQWNWTIFQANSAIRRIAHLRRECAMLSGSGIDDDQVRVRLIKLEMLKAVERVGELERRAARLEPDDVPRWRNAALFAGGAWLTLRVWHCPRCRMEILGEEEREREVHPGSGKHKRCGERVRRGTARKAPVKVWRRVAGEASR